MMHEEAIITIKARIDVYQHQIDMRYLTLEGTKKCYQKIKELQQAIKVLEKEGK